MRNLVDVGESGEVLLDQLRTHAYGHIERAHSEHAVDPRPFHNVEHTRLVEAQIDTVMALSGIRGIPAGQYLAAKAAAIVHEINPDDESASARELHRVLSADKTLSHEDHLSALRGIEYTALKASPFEEKRVAQKAEDAAYRDIVPRLVATADTLSIAAPPIEAISWAVRLLTEIRRNNKLTPEALADFFRQDAEIIDNYVYLLGDEPAILLQNRAATSRMMRDLAAFESLPYFHNEDPEKTLDITKTPLGLYAARINQGCYDFA